MACLQEGHLLRVRDEAGVRVAEGALAALLLGNHGAQRRGQLADHNAEQSLGRKQRYGPRKANLLPKHKEER